MGVRKGQGFGVPKPKRVRCPECGKKGVTQWKATASGLLRECQYCSASWGEAGWEAAHSAELHHNEATRLHNQLHDRARALTALVDEMRLEGETRWASRLERLIAHEGKPS